MRGKERTVKIWKQAGLLLFAYEVGDGAVSSGAEREDGREWISDCTGFKPVPEEDVF